MKVSASGLRHLLGRVRHLSGRDARMHGGRIAIVLALLLAYSAVSLPVLAQEAAAPPRGKLIKLVILSRHGVRSPIPEQAELDSWTASKWPTWICKNGKPCERGELTPRGEELAQQMGTFYQKYLSSLLPGDQCPAAREVFFWADVADERTRDTGLALLQGFLPSCANRAQYFHLQAATDPIFHGVTGSACRLDAVRAEQDMMARAGGNLSNVVHALENELAKAEETLQCCQPKLCQATWDQTCQWVLPGPKTCSLTRQLPSCLVRRPKSATPVQVQLGGALRVASTFAEILLLEYANGFEGGDLGWGRIKPEELPALFSLHTTAFDLEQRTPYVAALQGSALLRRILLALRDETDKSPGAAPRGAKFVAYVGHDTNIANVAGMLDLSWTQPGYQRNQTPPAGALAFELREEAGIRNVNVFYVAQSLEDMHAGKGDRPIPTPVPVPNCGESGAACTLEKFETLVTQKLDPNCSQ